MFMSIPKLLICKFLKVMISNHEQLDGTSLWRLVLWSVMQMAHLQQVELDWELRLPKHFSISNSTVFKY